MAFENWQRFLHEVIGAPLPQDMSKKTKRTLPGKTGAERTERIWKETGKNFMCR